MHWTAINKLLGNIDLYWLDFILKGHLADDDRILDAGCGEGRNISYCMKLGYDVFGVDINPDALRFVKMLASQYKLPDAEGRFQQMDLTDLRFPDNSFDIVLSSAVLHFARDKAHFLRMLGECVRVLKPGGKLFIRTMTSKGFEDAPNQNLTEEGKHRFLLDDDLLAYCMDNFKLEFVEVPKNVVVSDVRSMAAYTFSKQN